MKIKACAYYHTEDDTCDLFKESHRGFYSFPSCEFITISKCPYKLFAVGKIGKEELNETIKKIQNERKK